MYAPGVAYLGAAGVESDRVKARLWLKHASFRGDRRAKALIAQMPS
jgi:TPR repeat protein